MAGRIAGITIKIGADDSGIKKAIRGLDSSLNKTQATLKDVNKLLKLDPKSTELLTQKQRNLEKAIADSKKKIEELKKAQNGVAKGSEDWDTLQREIIATEQQLQSLELEYRNFGSVGAQQVAAVGRSMQEIGGKIESVGNKLAPISKAAAGALVALGGLALSTINAADDLATLSQQTGISTDELQKMQYASDLVDVSLESITGALKKMKSKMDPANETFKRLGVSVTNADGSLRSATDVFYDSLQALSKIENEVERDQVAMELFGKSADELAGIIDDGGAGLQEYGKEAEDLGLILSEDTINSMLDLSNTLSRLKGTFSGAFAQLGATLADTFAPALEKVAGYAQRLAEKIAQLTPEQAQLIVSITGVVAAIAPLIIVGGKLVSGVGKILTLAPAIVSGVSTVVAAIGWIPLAIAGAIAAGVWLYKHWDQVKEWAASVGAAVTAAWESAKTSVSNAVTTLRTTVTKNWNTIKTVVTTAVNNLKSSVTSTWDSIKSSVATTVSGIYTSVVSKFNLLRSTASGIWNGIKNSISSAINTAKSAVSSAIDAIKGFLNFEWNLPQLKLPHINLTGGEWPWGIFGKGVAPTVSIDWYRRAYDNPVMFTSPTVLATPGGYKGFGDGNGAEIVLGLNRLQELVGSSGSVTVNVYPPAGANTEEIAAAVEQRLVAMQRRRMRVYA